VAIPAIKAEWVLIQAVASDEWWEGVTVPLLEMARKRLRALVKLIPKGQKRSFIPTLKTPSANSRTSTCRKQRPA